MISTSPSTEVRDPFTIGTRSNSTLLDASQPLVTTLIDNSSGAAGPQLLDYLPLVEPAGTLDPHDDDLRRMQSVFLVSQLARYGTLPVVINL